jgi:antitoxin YefM
MLSKHTNYTNLRQNLASILDETIEDRGVIIVIAIEAKIRT